MTGAVELIERLCAEEGLERKIRRPLRSWPGSTHWHWRRTSSNGTLEVTLWPEEGRIWLSVHANRVGPWTRETAIRLSQALEKEFGEL